MNSSGITLGMRHEIDRANHLHRLIDIRLRKTVANAIDLGKILTRLKASCGHGHWMPLFKKMILLFSIDAAEMYMVIADHTEDVKGCETITDAYAAAMKIK